MSEKKWYGVHTYSGYENKVKLNLEERIRSLGAEELFGEVLIPSETVVELKNGERKTSTRKFFPGYILVHVELNSETWHIVKDTPKVTGFVGGGTTPPPIPDDEVAKITARMEEGVERPKSSLRLVKPYGLSMVRSLISPALSKTLSLIRRSSRLWSASLAV